MLLRTERFKKDFQRLPPEIQDRCEKALRLLISNRSHPSLRIKKMEGAPGIWEMRVTDDYRITWQFAGAGILLRRVGTHNVLRQP